ncbi:MAG: hypothetical protein J6T73_05275 [Clostridia bacterium]|nr:hypothetical protein [Clostridia bacterium]
MKNTKPTIRRVFAVVSFVISAAIITYIIIVDVSLFLLFHSADTAAIDFLISGLVGGAFTAVLSAVGLSFSVLAATLFRSKTMKILSSVLILITAVSFLFGILLWRRAL